MQLPLFPARWSTRQLRAASPVPAPIRSLSPLLQPTPPATPPSPRPFNSPSPRLRARSPGQRLQASSTARHSLLLSSTQQPLSPAPSSIRRLLAQFLELVPILFRSPS